MRRLIVSFNQNSTARYGFAIDEGGPNIRHFGHFTITEGKEENRYAITWQSISKKDGFIEHEEKVLAISEYVWPDEKHEILQQFLETIILDHKEMHGGKIDQLLIPGMDLSELEDGEKILLRDLVLEMADNTDATFSEILFTDTLVNGAFYTRLPDCLDPITMPPGGDIQEATAYAIEAAIRQNAKEKERWELGSRELITEIREAIDVD